MRLCHQAEVYGQRVMHALAREVTVGLAESNDRLHVRFIISLHGGAMVGRWTRDHEVAGSNLDRSTFMHVMTLDKLFTHMCLCHQTV